MALKAELERVKSLNVGLESQNKKLIGDISAVEAKIAAVYSREKKEPMGEYQSLKFKDIRKLIANRLELSKIK